MTDKILKQVSKNICMIKNIKIGDPMYFEQFKGATLDKLVYNRSFRGKNSWVGYISIKEFEDSFIEIEISFAPNKDFLNIYKNLEHYSYQKTKHKMIGVDTASCVLCINDVASTIRTGMDGYLGDVF